MRKLFKTNLVTPYNLTTENIEGKRHYVLPDGTKLKSVTTILGERLDHSALDAWKARVGEEEAARVSAKASARGTAIHALAERYLLGVEKYEQGENPINLGTFQDIRRALDAHVDNIYGIELALFSKTLGCAGMADLVAEYDGVPTIIDFKTSTKPKKMEWIEGYILQSTVYSMMFQRLYGVEIPQIAVLIVVDFEGLQSFVLKRSLYVKRALEVFC